MDAPAAGVDLPANKTYSVRVSFFRPVSPDRLLGLLVILESNGGGTKPKTSRYAVRRESGTGADGRVYRLTKPGGKESYWVNLPADPKENLCDCDGFSAGFPCKHVLALSAHYAAGHLS